jgi:hypothetical protein
MKVLVFDPNVDFARRAVEFLRENVRDTKADLASNVFVLRKRLQEDTWDFVLADVTAAGFMGEVIDELKSVRCPVVVWSTLTDSVYADRQILDKFKLVRKPITSLEMSRTLNTLVETA